MLQNKISFSGKIIVVTGYTATGKTKLAIDLARQFDGEIVNADSRQVYKGLDIGTGKDLEDYLVGGQAVTHHLIDINKPEEIFDLYTFKNKAIEVIDKIIKRGKLAIVCGGTPLYIDALVNDYQFSGNAINDDFNKKFINYSYLQLMKYFEDNYPMKVNNFDLSQKQRIIRAIEIIESDEREKVSHCFKGDTLVLAPFYERKYIYQFIGDRLKKRWEGILNEVRELKQKQLISSERLNSLGLEYRYVNNFLEGHLLQEEAYELLFQAIRKFAKRQGTWFRKLERSGIEINWLADLSKAPGLVQDFLG